MSILKKIASKALGSLGLKAGTVGSGYYAGSGYKSRSLAKLTSNTAAPKYAVRSYYDKYLGGE